MTRRRLIYFVSLVIFIATHTACNKNNIIHRDKMVRILYDIQLAEAIHQVKYSEFKTKEDKDALIEGIFTKYDITQAELDSSLVWYSDNVEVYNRVNDSIIATLRRKSDLVNKESMKVGSIAKRDNSVLPDNFRITESTPTLSFSIDSLKVPLYPDFKVEFRALGVDKNSDVDFRVYFTYADTILVKYHKLKKSNSTSYVISKPRLKRDKLLKNIAGYIHLNNWNIPNQNILIYDIIVTDAVKVAKSNTTLINTHNKDTIPAK